jgi:uncharacterized protein (UPF0261 family)
MLESLAPNTVIRMEMSAIRTRLLQLQPQIPFTMMSLQIIFVHFLFSAPVATLLELTTLITSTVTTLMTLAMYHFPIVIPKLLVILDSVFAVVVKI